VGRKNVKDHRSSLQRSLGKQGVDLSLGNVRRKYGDHVGKYLELRRAWDEGAVYELPDTDVEHKVLTVAEISGAALVAEFALRRAANGVQPSRPIAVDAIRIVRRLGACLDAFVAVASASSGVERKLRWAAVVLSFAQFDLSRSLIGYVSTHPAPDVGAGRDSPDAWLDAQRTCDVRRELLARLVQAHRMLARPVVGFAALEPGGTALLQAQRVLAHVQVASLEANEEGLSESVRSTDWPNGAELEAIVASLEADVHNQSPEALIARSWIAFVESGEDNRRAALLKAAEIGGLKGRNLVSLLRTLLQVVATSDEATTIIDRILDEVEKAPPNERFLIQSEALPHVLASLAALSLEHPKQGCAISRRIVRLPVDLTLDSNHIWFVPGGTPVAIIEPIEGEPTTVELPLLANPKLLEELIINHAEEYVHTHDLGQLRRQLSAAIEPLKHSVCALGSPVTVHAFGALKHIPVAALTGKGSILATQPICKILARSPTSMRPDHPLTQRLFIVDDELRQAARLLRSDESEVLHFNSSARDERCFEAFDALEAAKARQVVFFGHGHVDQFRLGYTGLVVEQADTGNGFIPSAQIARMDLHSVEVAVVMACGAGQGSVFLEPYLSVGHAFRLAGVTHVVAPQWPIDAEIALDFTHRFLKLIDGGVDYIDAWGHVLAEDPNRFISIAVLGS
jgi:CHAT domain